MKHLFFKNIVVHSFAFCLFLSSFVYAQSNNGALVLEADQTEISEQQTLSVSATLNGQGYGDPNIAEPNWYEQGWEVINRSQSTSMRMINRRTDVEITYQYRLRPLKQGSLSVGPFKVILDQNQEIVSNVLSINVYQGPAKVAQSDRGINRYAFIRWEVDQKDLFPGQAFTARLMVYVNQQIRLTHFRPSEINLEGFWMQQIESKNSRNPYVRINGITYQQQEAASYILFPLKAEALKLPEVQAEMRISTLNFFAQDESITRVADAIELNVSPLPPNAPTGFKGLTVGKVSLIASMDKTKVKADEVIQFNLITQINGTLANTPAFEFPEVDGFKVFPPTEKTQNREQQGQLITTRQQTWLLKPTIGGKIKIPPFSMAYFDPQLKQYQVANTREFEIEVIGTPMNFSTNTVSVVSPSQNPTQNSNPAQNQTTSSTENPQAQSQTDAPLTMKSIRLTPQVKAENQTKRSFFVWLIALIGPALLLLDLLKEKWQQIENRNPEKKKAKQAYAQAKSQLKTIKSATHQESVSAVLISYLEDKFNKKLKGLSYDKLKAVLGDILSEKQVQFLIDLLDQEAFNRYSQSQNSQETRDQQIKAVDDYLEQIEQIKGKS